MTYQSVTFGANGEIVDTDLESHVRPANAMSDAQKANVGIRVHNTTDTFRFQQNGGPATAAPRVNSVQLQQPTGRVAIAGTTVAPDVYEKMKETSPELFQSEAEKAAKQAEAAAVVADAAAEEATRIQLNTFVDPAAEAAALHVNSDVSLSDRTQLLWQLHSTGTVNGPTLQRVAEQMYLPIDEAVDALNAIHLNHSMQVASLCGAKGVDAQAFGTWAKTHRATEMFRAVTVQANERDFVRLGLGWLTSSRHGASADMSDPRTN